SQSYLVENVKQEKIQICKRCIVNSQVPGASFNAQGFCNYCTGFINQHKDLIHKEPIQQQRELQTYLARVKRNGKGKKYDCIVGISGGVDSSWTLVQVKKLGLRPLAVHMDNGWNSELA